MEGQENRTRKGENSGHPRQVLSTDGCSPVVQKSNGLSCLDLELTVSSVRKSPGSWLLGEMEHLKCPLDKKNQ